MKILITGATGLVGKDLGKKLVLKGHKLTIVSRNKKRAIENVPFPCEVIEADLSQSPLTQKIDADIVINLIGEGLANQKWNQKAKEEFYKSRVLATKNLIASLNPSVKHLISTSAIGIYGDSQDVICTEDSSSTESTSQSIDELLKQKGNIFLSSLCKSWEAATNDFLNLNSKGLVTILRLGIVLSNKGGALKKMLTPFKAGLGGPLGDGQHYMSWIQIDDLINMICLFTEQQISGIFNAVSSNPITNRQFSDTLAKVLQRRLLAPIPKVALKTLYGEMAEVLLASQKVSNQKILALGFNFNFPSISSTLEHELKFSTKNNEHFIAEQYLPLPKELVFNFFSNAKNLEIITPSSLQFHIKRISTSEINQGTLIDYNLKIHSIPFHWKTLIDEWHPPHRFVDTQLNGPYEYWHHTHEFISLGEGTLILDSVVYRPPFGRLGWSASSYFVNKDVQSIFNFRRKKIFEICIDKKM